MGKDKKVVETGIRTEVKDSGNTPSIDPKNFDSSFLDKKLIMGCGVSALVSVITVFVIMKMGLNYHEQKIQSIAENCASIETRVKSIVETISDLNSAMDSLKSEWKEEKEHSSYLYTSISSLQNDVAVIKEKLNIDTAQSEDSVKKLSSEKGAFIDSFEKLIKDGAPFDSFLDSYCDKIDMKKYQTTDELIKFSKQNVKSLADLKKDYASVGYTIFQSNFEESFWEKQKRVIKEKISEAIKISKNDDNSEVNDDSSKLSDKAKFEKVGKLISDEKYSDAVKLLESLKIENDDLGTFTANVKKRLNLEAAFFEFKKEFIEMEGGSNFK